MIDYPTFHHLRFLHEQERLSAAQIAQTLHLDERTVAKWLKIKSYRARLSAKRPSKLDAFKAEIMRLLAAHPYSAQQLFQRLQEQGYAGGYTNLSQFVRQVRPKPSAAFLSLRFCAGQTAQVDWGAAGSIQIGSTRRRLSFFVMVLCYSRLLYVEFTLLQTQEHFLCAHQRAFEFFGGVPAELMVDNCKTAVLQHALGQPPVFNARYLDFAQHYHFTIKACGPRRAHEKGRVENAVGYIKKNFLAGLQLSSLDAINAAARTWLDKIANLRVHHETHKTPRELFEREEKPTLRKLNLLPYDTASLRTVLANRRCRVTLDTNRYSVPPACAGKMLLLKLYPERLCLYDPAKADQLIAEHPRSYERHQDFEKAEHVEQLLAQRKQARQQQHLSRFLALCPRAKDYYGALQEKRRNPLHHIQKILALAELYGSDKAQRALEDAWNYQAFSCEYIANLLEQRERKLPQAGALHLTRQQDLLDLDLPSPDLSCYGPQEGGPL